MRQAPPCARACHASAKTPFSSPHYFRLMPCSPDRFFFHYSPFFTTFFIISSRLSLFSPDFHFIFPKYFLFSHFSHFRRSVISLHF